MLKTFRFPFLCAVALLTACAGSPPASTRYLLPGDTVSAAAVAPAEPTGTLVIQPIRMADYLEAEGLVLQMDDIVMNEASSHRWAESLGLQLQRGLRQRLANRLPTVRVLEDSIAADEAMTLRVDVERFHGRNDGVAIAGGQWQLRNASGAVVYQESFNAQVTLDADGYSALVRALGRSWDQVAGLIANRILAAR